MIFKIVHDLTFYTPNTDQPVGFLQYAQIVHGNSRQEEKEYIVLNQKCSDNLEIMQIRNVIQLKAHG